MNVFDINIEDQKYFLLFHNITFSTTSNSHKSSKITYTKKQTFCRIKTNKNRRAAFRDFSPVFYILELSAFGRTLSLPLW
jgi:hypothetical protein